ncbi:CehA/McbA family metallohydrolase domain-containing protein [Flavihumibacter profundi]|jgi:hypothetical protein|uniref:hypothetical protein n=1 Tax=Flavihumibacter profundi TaxID=2716883 RepID=UPI001CC5F318|nr:hypothetical protein [Flavihumibacter profundi]MBZ5857297.1 hypothetical protein [Flavihumibacter profundi]
MIKKIVKYFFIFVLGLLLVVLVFLFSAGLWHRWVTYPRFDKQVKAFQDRRKEPEALTALHTYRGALHAHSYWSHDSRGRLSDIIPAAKKAGIDFIFLTDHAHGDKDTIPRGYHGYYDGVLIEPGTEREGYCTWPLDSAVIDWTVKKDTVVKNVVTNGGIIFYAHSEEEHNWDNPYFQGMEIYNIHTDIKDESLRPLICNFITSGTKYKEWAMREIFDEQVDILAHWDALNSKRKIVGFAAVDAHENQNIRARYLEDGRVEWVGPDNHAIDTVEASIWNRWMFHAPDENGWIFKFMTDTYQASFNMVTNYVVADTLSVPSIANSLKKGNLFIAFKSLGDAKGFMFCSKNAEGKVSGILGDSVRIDNVKSFQVVSPLPGQFRLIRDGKVINVSADDQYQFTWSEPVRKGVYRLEMHIKIDGKYIPWVYTNPVYVY